MWLSAVREQVRLAPATKTAITIGTFDGVHVGHQKVVGTLLELAGKRGLSPLVLAFRRSPVQFFAPDKQIDYIGDIEARLRLLNELGAEQVALLDFDSDLQKLSAERFLSSLRQDLNCHLFVAGAGATIGANRTATDTLPQVAAEADMEVAVVPAVQVGQKAVHSSLIRTAIAEGELQTATAMLGRNFTMRGIVVKGDRLGRELGFPTANLGLTPNLLIPADGVYATRVRLNTRQYDGATSIGTRPTVSSSGAVTVETYIMDFDADIYGQLVEIEFVERLRDELKFDDMEQLKQRMAQDVREAQAVLVA